MWLITCSKWGRFISKWFPPPVGKATDRLVLNHILTKQECRSMIDFSCSVAKFVVGIKRLQKNAP
jgi:hypothetical protein